MIEDRPPYEQGLPAGFVSRLIAFTIDLAILVAVASTLSFVAVFVSSNIGMSQTVQRVLVLMATATAFIIQSFYIVVFTAMGGQTVGKRLMGLRVVQLDGRQVKSKAALKRYIGYLLSLPLFWGYLMVLVNSRRLAFHDKLAGTIVIYYTTAPGVPGPLEHTVRVLVERRRARQAARHAALIAQGDESAERHPDA